MGVKYLTAFVWHHKLLRDEQLPGGNLVIDGNNLLWTLFDLLKDVNECVYQEFARKLGTFFSNLKRSRISPIVFIDGGYDSDFARLPLLLQRLQTEISDAIDGTDAQNAERKASKSLLKLMFIQIPVFAATKTRQTLRCKVFHPESFCELFHITQDMMPFVATLPGNDIFPRYLFDDFFEKLGAGEASARPGQEVRSDAAKQEQLKRLELLMHWLAEQKSPALALEKVLEYVCEDQRERLREFLLGFSSSLDRVSLDFLPDGVAALLAGSSPAPLVNQRCYYPLEPAPEDGPLTPPAGSSPAPLVNQRCCYPLEVATPAGAATSGVRAAPEDGPLTPPAGSSPAPLVNQRCCYPLEVATPAGAATSGVRAAPEDEPLTPPALLDVLVRGGVPGVCVSGVFGLPWRLFPGVDAPELPCSALAAVPLLARLSALLGAPVAPLVLFTRHERQLRRLLASCTWRAPLLERVLLGGAAARQQTLLTVLRLRPAVLVAVPPLLQLPVAALLEWRRVTAGRSGRHQVHAVLLTLLALTPDNTPPEALGLSAAAAAAWRDKTAQLRRGGMPEACFSLSAMHLYSELQSVYGAVCGVNETLARPLPQLDVQHTLLAALTMKLGFSRDQPGDHDVRAGKEVEALVSKVANTIKDEIDRAQDTEDSWNYAAPPWRPWAPNGERTASGSGEHPDLAAVRALTGILNKITERNRDIMTRALRGLTVKTEYGLYTMVDTVYRRVLAQPDTVPECAAVCGILAKLEVPSRRQGGTVRFADLLATRLLLGVRPIRRGPPQHNQVHQQQEGEDQDQQLQQHQEQHQVHQQQEGEDQQQQDLGRAPPGRRDVLSHLETVSDRGERVRQFRQLAAAWREAERRRRVCLRLLEDVVGRRLVPADTVRRALQRLLAPAGDGQPAGGQDARQFNTEWDVPTQGEARHLLELVQRCSGGAQQ